MLEIKFNQKYLKSLLELRNSCTDLYLFHNNLIWLRIQDVREEDHIIIIHEGSLGADCEHESWPGDGTQLGVSLSTVICCQEKLTDFPNQKSSTITVQTKPISAVPTMVRQLTR